MSRDRSLDEFASGSDTASDEADDEAPDGEAPDVEPIETTYAWSPGGGACESCGATVESRWRQGGELVCADCKEW